jgi:hypothetical protein
MGASRDDKEQDKRRAIEPSQLIDHEDPTFDWEPRGTLIAPGKWTEAMLQLPEVQTEATRVRGKRAPTPWPDSLRSPFDGFVARGVQDVTHALTTREAPVARIAERGSTTGMALWHVAERRAATLYRHAQDHGDVSADDPAVDEALGRIGTGAALTDDVRKELEQELGVALGRVRVHTDTVAADAARAVRAHAFTVGEDIFFAAGAYAPGTREGRKLLAHEVAHVVQSWQGRTASGGKRRVSNEGDALEKEADSVAARFDTRSARAPREVPRAARVAPAAAAPASRDAMLLRKVKSVGKNRKPPAGPDPKQAAKIVGAILDILNHSVEIKDGMATAMDTPAAHPDVPAQWQPLLVEWWRLSAGTWTEAVSGSMTYWYKGATLAKHLQDALAATAPFLGMLRKDKSADAYLAETFDTRVAEIRARATQQQVDSAIELGAAKREGGELDLDEMANLHQLQLGSITALKVVRAVLTASTRIASLNVNEAKAADKLHAELVGEANVNKALLQSGRATTIQSSLGHVQGVVYLIQSISNIADHKKRYEAYEKQWSKFGKVAGTTEFMKDLGLALGGVTTICSLSTLALAKATDQAELVTKLVALNQSAGKWMTKINITLNALGVIHGVAVLVNPESTEAEKLEAGVEASSGALGLLGRFIPRIAPVTTAMTVSMLVNFYMFKHLLEQTAGAEAGMVALGLNMCYARMLETGKQMSAQATHYATALDLKETGTFTDPAQKAELDKQIEANRWNLVEAFIKPFLVKATTSRGAGNADPGAYTVLARKFAALGKPVLETPEQTIDFTARLIGALAECFANAQDIYVQQVHEVMTGAPKPSAAPGTVQKKAAGGAGGDVHAAAERGTSGTSGALPHLDPIQRAFGRHDVSGIRSHSDANAAEGAHAMGAEAFAMGDRVAFSRSPDLHTAAHEAAHVIQQRAGVSLSGGVGQEGDSHERHADLVADLVVQGKSAEALLDLYASGSSGGGTGIQRKVGLEFETSVKLSSRFQVKNARANPELTDEDKAEYAGRGDDEWIEIPVDYKTVVGKGSGWHIEADSSSIEFVTDPFSDRKALADVMATIELACTNIEASTAASGSVKPTVRQALAAQTVKEPKMGYAVGDGKAAKIIAAPQATGGVPLDKIPELFTSVGKQKLDFLKDNEGAKNHGDLNLMGMTTTANKVVVDGAGYAKKYIEWYVKAEKDKGNAVDAKDYAALEGLLALVYSYLVSGAQQQVVFPYSKMIAPIMARVDFSTMHASLSDAEQAAFLPAAVLAQANLAGADRIFAKGYGVPGKDLRHGPSRTGWLETIQDGEMPDMMSAEGGTSVASTHNEDGEAVGNSGTSSGMGAMHEMDTAGDGTPLAVLELRRLPKGARPSNWTKIALTVYDYFATFDPALKPRERGLAIGGGDGAPKALPQ